MVKIFKDNEDDKFDRNFKIKVEKEVKNYSDDKEKNKNIQLHLNNVKKLSRIIRNLKRTLRSGENKISNDVEKSWWKYSKSSSASI